MQFAFLKNGAVAFIRSDAEEATWTQEEQTVNATFPYIREKEIQRGMVLVFDYLGAWYAFEIRNATVIMGDSYQQLTAEGIAISELTDCHIGDDSEITDKTARAALETVLNGTDWQVGTDTSTGKSRCDIERGSVWQAVNTIATNWNVYITPRVTFGSEGITGRYLDISSPGGVWRGLRLSIDKNMTDSTVTYDDTELYTALYGYGGSVAAEGDTESKEVTFEGISWAKTADHPAKPKGLKYLEYPEMTALYGRNGKPRFGFYQNTNIKDAQTLLNKTWESLKACCEPKVSITGTVTDLKRLGFPDVPVMLHDVAVVEIRPAGVLLQREVIQATIDLLNAEATTPTVGDYIPNIIYINRDTYDITTGEGGGASGGRGGSGGNRKDKKRGQFETDVLINERNITMYGRQIDEAGNILRQAGMKIDPITGVLIYAEDKPNMIGSQFRVQSNAISAEVTKRTEEGAKIRAQLKVQSDKISLVVTEKDGKNNVNAASIVAGINDQHNQHSSYIKLRADTIDLRGYVTVSNLEATNAKINNLTSGATTASSLKTNLLSAGVGFTYQNHNISFKTITISGTTYHLMGY